MVEVTRARTSRSRLLPWFEMAVVIAIFVGDRFHLIPISKTPFLFALGWISLRQRGLTWRDVGLARPRNWALALGLGLLFGLCMEGLELFVTQPLLAKFLGAQPDFSAFQRLHGNVKLFFISILFAWTFAAFGEEMVWRGYLMNRVAGLISRRGAWTASLILVNTVFGLAHAYQGATGVLDEAIMGAILGLVYLACRRNLAVPIVAHGVADSVDALLFFVGHYPGT
jgi:membrane protease YdiL (CAAX protease family)